MIKEAFLCWQLLGNCNEVSSEKHFTSVREIGKNARPLSIRMCISKTAAPIVHISIFESDSFTAGVSSGFATFIFAK
jgi:hypothetical protein